MLHVRLLPDQQNFSPAGVAILEIWYELLLGILKLTQVYLVRLWLSGRWRDIIVDDQLPCVGNGVGTCATQDRATQRPVRHAQRRKSCASKRYRQLAYCSTRRCQLWASIIEKAFAKACGSYEALVGGEAEEALSVLTGWPCETIQFDREDFDSSILWATMCTSRDARFLMTVSTSSGKSRSDEDIRAVGLVPNHAYSLIDVLDVLDAGGDRVRLLKIRNPHAQDKWRGNWSESSRLWTPELRQRVGAAKAMEAGMFFMGYGDFLKWFERCTICKVQGDGWHKVRMPTPLPGNSAAPNQGWMLSVSEMTECCLAIAQPQDRARSGPLFQDLKLGPIQHAGFVLVSVEEGAQQQKPLSVAVGHPRSRPVVSADCWLKPGFLYYLLPLSLMEGPEVPAVLSCFSRKAVQIREHSFSNMGVVTSWATFVRFSAHRPDNFHGAMVYTTKSNGGMVVSMAENHGKGHFQVDLDFQQQGCELAFSRPPGLLDPPGLSAPSPRTPNGQAEDNASHFCSSSNGGDETSRIPCTAGGRIPIPSDFTHCPHLQSFVRCGPHHRAELCMLNKDDIRKLHDIWSRYRDDLCSPQHSEKPTFSPEDFDTFYRIAQKVVDAMVEEYRVPMVLDQATISNTNHKGHPPHADNVRFDSVWWHGKRITGEDELPAARKGAYILWRAEKTSYRSYSCSVSLTDPNGYEGGEIQFFDRWGSSPVASYKCAEGCGIAFCGCHKNIHAVTGVRRGFRLVLLVWTRPPGARVPDAQGTVCYFRPGTGRGCWLHTAEIQRGLARRAGRDGAWVPRDVDDETCQCQDCLAERTKVSWKDCLRDTCMPSKSTPSTSAGNSPRSPSTPDSLEDGSAPPKPVGGPHGQPKTWCGPHERQELPNILCDDDVRTLHAIWQRHHDDLTHPWYKNKPRFSGKEFSEFRGIAQKVVDAMALQFHMPLVLDQAAVNSTNQHGHPPHADNVQFDSVWWDGRQIKQRDEVEAARGGAEVLWRPSKTNYRNYSASIALTDPDEYGGGELQFFSTWGAKTPAATMRLPCGSGIAFCGCQRNMHAVTGVKWGFRLVMCVWTRHPDAPVPLEQLRVCYFRPGSGLSIWLTSDDLHKYPKRRRKNEMLHDSEEEDADMHEASD
ncbi:unnamed protein product [Effrenium voratum]|nr:unnamed protein product [Effrenium voratum]